MQTINTGMNELMKYFTPFLEFSLPVKNIECSYENVKKKDNDMISHAMSANYSNFSEKMIDR